MSAEQQVEKEIREAIVFLRENNHTVPSETLEFMKVASLEKLRENTLELKTYFFDCWDRNGNTYVKEITQLNKKNAKIMFEHQFPDLAYDEPYC